MHRRSTRRRASCRMELRRPPVARRSECTSTASSAPAVDRDRQAVEEDLVLGGRDLGLEPPDEGRCSRSGGEQPRHDLFGRLELDELLLERLRETPVTEVPAVELLQETDGPLLAELAHRLADEDDELRGHLL